MDVREKHGTLSRMTARVLTWLETRRGFVLAVSAIAAVMAALRLVRITFPESQVFDEVYSPVFAWNLLHGEAFFDVHPILAELPHTIGLLLFGNTPLGRRFSPWLWGMVFTWGAALTARYLYRRRVAGVLAALLVSLDTAYFIYGRTGLPDMFLLSQLSLAYACFFLSIRARRRRTAIFAALASGIFLGNAVSTKWLALASVASVWLWLGLQEMQAWWSRRWSRREDGVHVREVPHVPAWLLPIAFLLVPALVYGAWALVLSGWRGSIHETWKAIATWHSQVWNYHAHLTATHPYASQWWQWPFLLHPVLFFFESAEGGRRVINAIGNFFLWWTGFVALLGSSAWLLYRAGIWASGSLVWPGRGGKQQAAVRRIPPSDDFLSPATMLWLVLTALMFWLPWAFISRVSFNYHYFASFFFEVLLLTGWLLVILAHRQYRAFVMLYLAASAIAFILLYPSATGLLIPVWVTKAKWLFP